MLVAGAHVQASQQKHLIRLCDGHGMVEVVYKDLYGLIEKNKNNDVPVPRAYMPVGVNDWADLTPCRVMAWCESMQWRDGDRAAAFILIVVGLGKAFAIRPALLSPLLVCRAVERETLGCDSSDDGLEVAQLGGDSADDESGEEGEGDEADEEIGADDPRLGLQGPALSAHPGAEFAPAILERIDRLHGAGATKAQKQAEYLEGMGGKSKRYKPGCLPQGWTSSAGDFNKAYTDTVPKSVREQDHDAGLELKKRTCLQ